MADDSDVESAEVALANENLHDLRDNAVINDIVAENEDTSNRAPSSTVGGRSPSLVTNRRTSSSSSSWSPDHESTTDSLLSPSIMGRQRRRRRTIQRARERLEIASPYTRSPNVFDSNDDTVSLDSSPERVLNELSPIAGSSSATVGELDQVAPPCSSNFVPTGTTKCSNVNNSQTDEKVGGSSANDVKNDSGTEKLKTESDSTCAICMEFFTATGDHRPSSLCCGHVFGYLCIIRWLTVRGRRDGRCPQCNTKARKQDVRPLYVGSGIMMLDTSERDNALKELAKEREARVKLQFEVTRQQHKYQQTLAELGRLQEFVNRQTQTRNVSDTMDKARLLGRSLISAGRLALNKAVTICQDGKCRVMAPLDYFTMMVVSRQSSNPLFPGYGLTKVNLLNFRAYEYVPIHTDAIRDVAHDASWMPELVLTASTDHRLKLTNILNNQIVQTFEAGRSVWSCTWNLDNHYQFFAGLANGIILLFDTRKPTESVHELRCSESNKAVISLQYIQMGPTVQFSCGGLLACKLDGCYFCETRSDNEFQVDPLDTAEIGTCTSMSYDPIGSHLMISRRPNAIHKTMRHLVSELSQMPLDADNRRTCQSNVVQTFYGGAAHKTLNRSRLMRSPFDADTVVACVSDESTSSVLLWDVNNNSRMQTLPVGGTVLDVCPITVNNEHFLGALTENTLNVFQWHLP